MSSTPALRWPGSPAGGRRGPTHGRHHGQPELAGKAIRWGVDGDFERCIVAVHAKVAEHDKPCWRACLAHEPARVML